MQLRDSVIVTKNKLVLNEERDYDAHESRQREVDGLWDLHTIKGIGGAANHGSVKDLQQQVARQCLV